MNKPFTIWTRAHVYPRVMVVMFWPAANAATGSILGDAYAQIAAKALYTPGWSLFTPERSGQMDAARTKACMHAIRTGHTHILQLDCDHRHPADITERLLAHGKDVVGGLNFMRGYPHRACASSEIHVIGQLESGRAHAKHIQPIQHTGLQKVKAIGTGCLLIKLDCLKRLKQPWFYFPYHDIDYADLEQPWAGEDGGFSLKCQRSGVEMWCDTDLTSPHLAQHWVDRTEVEENKPI